jgi:hypothetical protein
VKEVRTAGGENLKDLEERIFVPEWRCSMRERQAWLCGMSRPFLPQHMQHIADHLDTQVRCSRHMHTEALWLWLTVARITDCKLVHIRGDGRSRGVGEGQNINQSVPCVLWGS